MSRISLKNQAKSIIKGKYINISLIMLAGVLLLALIDLIPIIGVVAGFLLTGPLLFSISYITYKVATEKTIPKFQDLFFGFRQENFTRAFEGYIRYAIFVFLWSMLFVIPGIVKAISYSQMSFLMIENPDMTAGEAQKKSMEITKGRKMDLFVLSLSFIPWQILVALTMGIAAFFVVPYVNVTFALYYLSIRKDSSSTL